MENAQKGEIPADDKVFLARLSKHAKNPQKMHPHLMGQVRTILRKSKKRKVPRSLFLLYLKLPLWFVFLSLASFPSLRLSLSFSLPGRWFHHRHSTCPRHYARTCLRGKTTAGTSRRAADKGQTLDGKDTIWRRILTLRCRRSFCEIENFKANTQMQH